MSASVTTPTIAPFLDTRTASLSTIRFATAVIGVPSGTTGNGWAIISDMGVRESSSIVKPSLIRSNIMRSVMLPTGTPSSMTGSCECPSAIMISDARWTSSVLGMDTTFEDAIIDTFRLPPSTLMASSVSNRRTTISYEAEILPHSILAMVLWLTPEALESSACVTSRDLRVFLMSLTGGNFMRGRLYSY